MERTAQVANVRFFARVRPHMDRDLIGCESLAANGANVGFFAGVYSRVYG